MSHSLTSAAAQPRIDDVQVLSTGSGEQHREHRYGSRLPTILWVLTSRSWVEFPINVFVIQHRDGLVLFDAGMDPAIASDPGYVDSAIGRFFMRRIFRLHIRSGDSLARQLERLGYGAADVSKIVVSHLHFDHIGGIADVPHAELIVSRDEWRQLEGPHPERDYFFREHIELPGADWHPIDFVPTDDPLLAGFGACHDLMGDGSMLLLPTPGHTKGSLSMLVRADRRPPLLLVGDLTYETDLLMKDRLPGVCADKEQLKASFARVRDLQARLPDLIILSSHDPAAAGLLQSAYAANPDESKVA